MLRAVRRRRGLKSSIVGEWSEATILRRVALASWSRITFEAIVWRSLVFRQFRWPCCLAEVQQRSVFAATLPMVLNDRIAFPSRLSWSRTIPHQSFIPSQGIPKTVEVAFVSSSSTAVLSSCSLVTSFINVTECVRGVYVTERVSHRFLNLRCWRRVSNKSSKTTHDTASNCEVAQPCASKTAASHRWVLNRCVPHLVRRLALVPLYSKNSIVVQSATQPCCIAASSLTCSSEASSAHQPLANFSRRLSHVSLSRESFSTDWQSHFVVFLAGF